MILILVPRGQTPPIGNFPRRAKCLPQHECCENAISLHHGTTRRFQAADCIYPCVIRPTVRGGRGLITYGAASERRLVRLPVSLARSRATGGSGRPFFTSLIILRDYVRADGARLSGRMRSSGMPDRNAVSDKRPSILPMPTVRQDSVTGTNVPFGKCSARGAVSCPSMAGARPVSRFTMAGWRSSRPNT